MAENKELTYLGTQAEFGVAKHMDGFKATKELARLCRIRKGAHILDVGCGMGLTACWLAKEYECKVIGIDFSEKMIEWSKKNAKIEHVEDKVEFMVADAQALPFEDESFDVVICESVLVFVKNREKAMREYVRVAKRGGYIGLNEATWLKPSPPENVLEYLTIFEEVKDFLDANGWKKLLDRVGLKEVEMRVHTISTKSETTARIKMFGIRRVLAALWRILTSFILKPHYRKMIIKLLKAVKTIPTELYEYWGYGIYVGRK